jgi:hypothetical protein
MLTAPGQSSDETHRLKVDPTVLATFLSTQQTLSRCNTAYASSWEVALFYKDTPEGGSTGVDTLIFLGPSDSACCDETESVLEFSIGALQLPEMGLFDMIISVNCPYN